jgi:hypothetical protein
VRLTKSQARKIAVILNAYADGATIQVKPANLSTKHPLGAWRDGHILMNNTAAWLRTHRIKPEGKTCA